jgi:sec-independent protein translocase protein TatA
MHSMFAFLPPGMEWIWVFLIIVVLFGAKKIPDLARGLGKSVGEFKKAKTEFEKESDKAEKGEDDTKPPVIVDSTKK